MLNTDEINQAKMPLSWLIKFDELINSSLSDIELDYVMLDGVELNFD